MNKNQFLLELEKGLKKISLDERQDIIQDFKEHFAIGLGEGKSEEQISEALGSPQQIAKELLANYHLEKAEVTATTGNIFRAVWAVIGLGFFNLVIVLGLFIALLGILFAGWIVGISFIASPLLVLLNAIVHPSVFELFELFFSMTLAGLGMFISIGMYYVTKMLVAGFIRYLKFNVNLVKGGLKHA